MVEDRQHRDVDVLMLYPLDLVAVDERFGSWMTQYGYANYITREKLLERGKVVDGAIEIAGRRFTTLVALFEPFPTDRLLEMMRELADSGGRVVWSGPPPTLTDAGRPALPAWQTLFGVDYTPGRNIGLQAVGEQVRFEGALRDVTPQRILTHFQVDRIYPVVPRDKTAAVARMGQRIVGTMRARPGGGSATVLGYRPRDDQSQSLGSETQNWFAVLSALGAYSPTGKFPGVNDNCEHLSRTTDYLTCRFPNGAVAIARHFRTFAEGWPGGFARRAKVDQAYMAKRTLPDDTLRLDKLKVNGHEVTYQGRLAMAFRSNNAGELVAFAGADCKRITVDGRQTRFADHPLAQIAWAPVPPVRRVDGGAALQVRVFGQGTIRVPRGQLPARIELIAEGPTPGSRGHAVPAYWDDAALVFEITPRESGRNLWAVPKKVSPGKPWASALRLTPNQPARASVRFALRTGSR